MENEIVARNVAGAGAREMANGRYRLRLWVGLFGFGCLAGIQWGGFPIRTVPQFLACMIGLLAVDRFILPCLDWLKKRQGHATRGAQAEETVGAILDRLPKDCFVPHDLDTGNGNIDHVVFRQDGALFLIETKSHHGTVSEENGQLRQNGRPFEKNILAQTHGNLFWLRDFLQVRLGITPWINAVIVFPSAYVSVRRTLRGIDVINSGYLEKWIGKVRGNPQVAKKLWPQMDRLRHEIRAAGQPKR